MIVGFELPASEHVRPPAEHHPLSIVLWFWQVRADCDVAPVEHVYRRGRGIGGVQAAQQRRPP